jgi:hypothetical protein
MSDDDLKKRADKIDERLRKTDTGASKAGGAKAAEAPKDWVDDDKAKRRKLGGRTDANGWFISDGLGAAQCRPQYNVFDAPSPDWIFNKD